MQTLLRWLKYIFIIYTLHTTLIQTNAYVDVTVSKKDLSFEVLSIETSQNELIVRGWAFISYKQHFNNASDHTTYLEFFNINDHFRVQANLTNISQSQMMTYFGSPTCSSNSTFQMPEVCNYSYEQVGFEMKVPLDRFKAGDSYQTNIIVQAHTAGISYKTALYYPLQNDLILSSASRETIVSSRLDTTELKINATTVLARKQAQKQSEYWFYGSNCSTTYRNQLFFQVNTIYRRIHEKVIKENTSYYRVGGNLNVCYDARRRITEGTLIQPVWIASPYVLYSGTPLQIKVNLKNQAPYFIKEEINIYQGETFVLTDHVQAIDPEEGDISHRIIEISSNLDRFTIGRYTINIQVSDNEGLSSNTSVFVNVLTKPNNAPIINASDLKIQQFSNFDGLYYVSAYDDEDGDLTDKVSLLNIIDTSLLNDQELCYYVEDTKLLSTTKCIIVSIYSYQELMNKVRYISKNNMFYNESLPTNWISKQMDLEYAILNETALEIHSIN